MHKHILIPTDGSDLSYEAIQYGTALAKAADAKVTGITVLRPFHVFAAEPEMLEDTAESYRKRMATVAAQRLAKVEEAAKAAGVTCEAVHVENEHPYKAIIDIANAKSCDLIVMASTRTARDFCSCARQRDSQGAHAQHYSRPRLPRRPCWAVFSIFRGILGHLLRASARRRTFARSCVGLVHGELTI